MSANMKVRKKAEMRESMMVELLVVTMVDNLA